MLMRYLTLVYTHLKWVLNFLLYYPFYELNDSHLPIIGEEHIIWHYEPTSGSEEDVECVVCLSKIEKGEQIRVLLRCDHVYHRDCLDRWVGFKNVTCPLCRESMGPRMAINELGVEVLSFDFSAIRNDDRDTWWLR